MECVDHSPNLWDEWFVFSDGRPTSLTTAIRHARLPATLSRPPDQSRGPCTRTRPSHMRIHRFAPTGKYRFGSARRNCSIVSSSFCPRVPPIARYTAAQLYCATTCRACTAAAAKHRPSRFGDCDCGRFYGPKSPCPTFPDNYRSFS
jgi:hypothetical protein